MSTCDCLQSMKRLINKAALGTSILLGMPCSSPWEILKSQCKGNRQPRASTVETDTSRGVRELKEIDS